MPAATSPIPQCQREQNGWEELFEYILSTNFCVAEFTIKRSNPEADQGSLCRLSHNERQEGLLGLCCHIMTVHLRKVPSRHGIQAMQTSARFSD